MNNFNVDDLEPSARAPSYGRSFLYFDAARRRIFGELVSHFCDGAGLFVLSGDGGLGASTLLRRAVAEAREQDALVFATWEGSRPVSMDDVVSQWRKAATGRADPIVTNDGAEASPASIEPRPALALDNAEALSLPVWRIILESVGGAPIVLTVDRSWLDWMARLAQTDDLSTIATVHHLEPLAARDAARYLRARMRMLPFGADRLLAPEAEARIVRAARGSPAAINRLCDDAIAAAKIDDDGRVTVENVEPAWPGDKESPFGSERCAPKAAVARDADRTIPDFTTQAALIREAIDRFEPDQPTSLGRSREEPAPPLPRIRKEVRTLTRRKGRRLHRKVAFTFGGIGLLMFAVLAFRSEMTPDGSRTAADDDLRSHVGEANPPSADHRGSLEAPPSPMLSPSGFFTPPPAGSIPRVSDGASLSSPDPKNSDPPQAVGLGAEPAAPTPKALRTESAPAPKIVSVPDRPAPRPDAPQRAAAKPSAPQAASAPSVAVPPPEPSDKASSEEGRPRPLKELIAMGDEFLASGDLEWARRYYRAAEERGSGRAAIALGETYDPNFVSVHQGDAAEARRWYEIARRRGDREAGVRLEALGSSVKIE